jgi:hypothetical protein
VQLDGDERLSGSVKRLLAAAAMLQQSPELAAAGPLPFDAQLPGILQRSMALYVAHNITTADILSMPRNELPALWAALWAAEECLGCLVAGIHEGVVLGPLKVGGALKMA